MCLGRRIFKLVLHLRHGAHDAWTALQCIILSLHIQCVAGPSGSPATALPLQHARPLRMLTVLLPSRPALLARGIVSVAS